MRNVANGLEAGLIATIVLSALMAMKSVMGVMPELDLSGIYAGLLGNPDMPIIGWIIYFTIGVVLYGAAITLLSARWPSRSHVGHGLLLGVVGWCFMMLVLMPMSGAGLFGAHLGVMAPMMTLALHLAFGAVLGAVYNQSIVGEYAMAPT